MDANREKVKVSRLCEILRKRIQDFECGVYPLMAVFDQKRRNLDMNPFQNLQVILLPH